MRHKLVVDIGNTNISMGIFKGRRLIKKTEIPTRKLSLYRIRLSKFLGKTVIEDVIVSSVVPNALIRIKKALSGMIKAKILVLGKNIKVPIKNLYKVKREVGQDRLVNAFAARALYGSPAIVIDFGTAITFDIVSKRGEYLGGLILPGVEMSLNGLYEKTALLPKVDLASSPHIIGKDTVNSIRGGILFGFGAMCDGLVSEYRKILGRNVKVIATGGNVRLIKQYAKSLRIVDGELTLKGLSLILG